MSSSVFSPLRLRDVSIPGRVWVSPMCQYSCRPFEPGFVTDWHLAHLTSFAVGGAPMILTEATAVTKEGRISPWDAGLWEDQQIMAWQRVVSQVHQVGSRIAVQLAHAGRKASTYAPFHADARGSIPDEDGGWQSVGATSASFGSLAAPRPLSSDEIPWIVAAFASAARRAVTAGFDAVEIHAAHGYLLSQFLSPLVNDRTDEYGVTEQGRSKLVLDVVDAVRGVLPDRIPLLVRLSATDWSSEAPGGIDGDVERTVRLSIDLADRGVDLIDVSSGGNVPAPQVPAGPGYQTRFAAAVKQEVDIPVGMITRPGQAQQILKAGTADVVMLGRAALADPRWWHRAGVALGHDVPWPGPYQRVVDRDVY